MAQLTDPSQLCDLLGIPFTKEQLAAISADHSRPVSIIAGAGSGKTSVMAARVVWLVGSGAIRPDQVLGLSFTRKAMRELSERIELSLRKLGAVSGAVSGPVEAIGIAPTVATYDSFASTLVTEFGARLGIESDLRLMNDASRFQLAAHAVSRYTGSIHDPNANVGALAGRVLNLDAELTAHRVSVATARDHNDATLAAIDAALLSEKTKGELPDVREALLKRADLLNLVDDFRSEKQRAGVIQFADVTAAAAQVAVEVPEAKTTMCERFSIVLLDEYQDTSVAQRDMLLGLFGTGFGITAVGDPCQAIYGWRGASVTNIKQFLRDFDLDATEAQRLTLRTNMRSDGMLLGAANAIASPLRDSHPVEPLEPLAHRAELGEITIARLDHIDSEIDFVVDAIAASIAAGTAPEEIAVLTRANTYLADIHAALGAAGIRSELVGLSGLIHTAEVADVIAVLNVVAEPSANASLLRLLTGPRWRIGMRDLALLGRRAEQLVRAELSGSQDGQSSLLRAVERGDAADVVSLADALGDLGDEGYSAEARYRFERLGSELSMLRSKASEPLADLTARVIRQTGLDIEVDAHSAAAGGRGREALDAFLRVAADYRDPRGESGLREFLGFLRLAGSEDRGMELELDAPPGGSDAVQLMTMHKAKGLEWDVVVTPLLYDGGFPKVDASGLWVKTAEVLQWPLRGDSEDMPVWWDVTADGIKELAEQTRMRADIEERRVAYVAFTRARHHLIATSHAWAGGVKERRASPYLLTLRDYVAEHECGQIAEWHEVEDPKANPFAEVARRRRVLSDPVDPAQRSAAVELVQSFINQPDQTVDLSSDELDIAAEWQHDAEAMIAAEIAARASDREVELPVMLSASQAMRLASDPDAFARSIIRPMPLQPSALARRGTVFHEWVEDHFGVRAMVDIDDLPGAADEEITDGDLESLREAFLQSPWSRAEPVELEAAFSLPIAGRVLIGRIDAIFAHEPSSEDPSRFHIIDWKTGRERSDPLQLAIYRLAWASQHGVPLVDVRAGFFYIRTGQTDWHDDLGGVEELTRLLSE